MRIALLAIAATTLASCNEPAPAPEANAARPEITVRSESQKRLASMNEPDRLIGLKRAIFASGYRCPRAEKSNFIGTFKNMDMWALRCSDEREWALFVGADDSVQVRLCKDTAKVGLPPCNFDTPGEGPAGDGPVAAQATDTKKPAAN